MSKGDLTTRVVPKCQRLCDQMDYELVDVALDKEPAGKYLRIYLDKETGITLDDCETYHRAIQPQLEDYDYDFLEVSSPGVDRPLKTQRDFERNQGQEVEVRLYKPEDGRKVYQGSLAGLIDGRVVIQTPQGEKSFAKTSVALCKPVVDMEGVDAMEFEE